MRVETRLRRGWTRFLKLENAPGWLFDVCPEDRDEPRKQAPADTDPSGNAGYPDLIS